jgi:DNA-binding PadR family transcriptional regulator
MLPGVMPKPTLQLFELHVLVAMLHEGNETYSVPLVLALEQRTGRPVAQAAVFIALKRLERKGLVTSRLHEPDDGRARRYFKLTRPGVAAIEATRAEHLRLWQGVRRPLRTRKA